MASYNLNEILKKRAALKNKDEKKEMDLGDTARVKVLSPMRQVMKRFMRNRLAIFGTVTLIIMFAFAFLGPLFYAYGQDEVIYKYDSMIAPYAFVQQRTEYTGYTLNPEIKYNRSAVAKTNSNINSMVRAGQTSMVFQGQDGKLYVLNNEAESTYTLSQGEPAKAAAFGSGPVKVGLYDGVKKTVKYEHEDLGEAFRQAAQDNCKGKGGSFEFEGKTYSFKPGSAKKTFDIFAEADESFRYYGENLGTAFETAAQAAKVGEIFEFNGRKYAVLSPEKDNYEVHTLDGIEPFMVYTQYAFDTCVTSLPLSDSFKLGALTAIYGEGSFEAEAIVNTEAFQKELADKAIAAQQNTHVDVNPVGEDEPAPEAQDTEAPAETGEGEVSPEGAVFVNARFTVAPSAERAGVLVISTEDGTPYAELNTLVARRSNGNDTMDLDLKHAVRDHIMHMLETNAQSENLTYQIPRQDDKGRNVYDEEGKLLYEESEMTVARRTANEFVVNAEQTRQFIDKYASPSSAHVMGTDGDGFDVLARIMYGGRISLMVGFVVVFLECFLGIIMGGLAGFFGGWVDNLVMRLVDIFYCLPFMPIMIIVGAMMDASRMDVYIRLFVLMAAMGIMGWAGIARLVRGQILSLREQEFMTAAEATGLPTTRRIFRHLVPNVMPQLIVSATMGLGSTILSESTLSFLGLGVKHPMATWGSMINSVASAAAMEQYAYIWIPVGLLICFTVIAFNFVGDGLRDAFDPKAKR
ncbi:MAG: ABC transporter permease [Oscillospiraceae bacterium]|nr:ABC transporter permease [Oscillospiraceae bacterium]